MEWTDDLRQKVRLLSAVPEGKFRSPRALVFVKDMHARIDKSPVSLAQLNYVEDLFRMLVKPSQDAKTREHMPFGRVDAYRTATGWQVYVDHKAVGVGMTKVDVTAVCQWLSRSLDSLEAVLQTPKPRVLDSVPETKQEKTDEQVGGSEGGQVGCEVGCVEDQWEAVHGL